MSRKPQLIANILRIGLLLAVIIYFFTHFDFTSLNLSGLSTPRQPQPLAPVQVNNAKEAVPTTPAPGSSRSPEYEERGYGIAADSTGNAVFTGYTYAGLDGLTNSGGSDAFLAKIASDDALW